MRAETEDWSMVLLKRMALAAAMSCLSEGAVAQVAAPGPAPELAKAHKMEAPASCAPAPAPVAKPAPSS